MNIQTAGLLQTAKTGERSDKVQFQTIANTIKRILMVGTT